MVDLNGMSIPQRSAAAASLMAADSTLTLKQAYERLAGESTPETRFFTDGERAVWSAALSAATDQALSISPFLSLLRPVYTDTIAGLAVDDGYRLMVGPWFFDKATKTIRPTLLLHEVLHPMLGHKQSRLHEETALIAGDCQINQGLRWNPWLDWPRRPDWTVEAVFPEDVKTPSYPDGLPEKHNFEWYCNELSSLSPDARRAVSDSVGDDACDGPLSPGQSAAMDTLGVAPAVESEVELTRQRAREVASNASMRGIGRGRGGQWDDWTREQLKPSREPWQRTIARQSRRLIDNALEAGTEEKSARRADRREWEDDPSMIRRGWVDPQVNVAVVLDVSGSMDADMLTALSELEAALKACDGARVTIVTADDGVTEVKTVTTARKMGRMRHGGGTALAPGVGWLAANLDPKPTLVIIITDGGLSDWSDMLDEIAHGALSKTTRFLFVITSSWGEGIPPAVLSLSNVEAWTIRDDAAEHVSAPKRGDLIDWNLRELGLDE